MEFKILYAFQSIHTPFLDKFVLALTDLAGNYGQLWVVIGALLLIFKKTRRCGLTMLLSYGMVFLFCQYGLKDFIARARPCHIDKTVELLVKRPSSYSCPSTHSCWAFAAATSVYLYFKKAGIFTFVVASLIALSRMYLFVHFPTDVVLGMIIGIAFGYIAKKVINSLKNKSLG